MKMTFDEYDNLLNKFKDMTTETYWPSPEQIMMFQNEPAKWLLFCIYLYEKGKEPINKKEKYSKANLRNFINSHLEIRG